MQLEPYLFFKNGACENALNAYTSILVGVVQGMTAIKICRPTKAPRSPREPKPRHARRFQGNGIAFMASDGRPGTQYGNSQVSLSLSVDNRAEADRIFNALSAGGTVDMPMQNVFWVRISECAPINSASTG